jgi:hypothetical protein
LAAIADGRGCYQTDAFMLVFVFDFHVRHGLGPL